MDGSFPINRISCPMLATVREEWGREHLSNICNILFIIQQSDFVGFQKYKLVRRRDSSEGAVGHVLGWCLQELSE